MPKVWQSNIKEGSLHGLWKITESPEELLPKLQQIQPRSFSNPQRNLHWLASRVLLEDMLGDMGVFRFELTYDEHGRPVINSPGLHVSISHAGDYAAVAVSETGPVGLDIELVHPRIEKIHHKFMNERELEMMQSQDRVTWMSLIWAAKESLFKYYAKGGVDFRSHLHIEDVFHDKLNARIAMEDMNRRLSLSYRFFEGYVFVLVDS